MVRLSRSLTLVGALVSLACGRVVPASGTVVADGVAKGTFEVRANGTDLIPVTVIFPADVDGRPVGRAQPWVLFVQGGAVDTSRYEWQGVELARQGVVTVFPSHPLALAFFAVDHGRATRRALLEAEPGSFLEGLVDPQRGAVAGHSLGGVVAAKLASSGEFQAAIVQASFPDPADEAKTRALTIPTLVLAAQGDCQALEAEVRAGWQTFPSPTALVVLEQATHFQFTDSDDADRARRCEPSLAIETAHARIIATITAFLRAALATPPASLSQALGALAGASVEVR